MAEAVVPKLLRSTLARVPVRGVPRLLGGVTKHTQAGGPRVLEVAPGTRLDLDLADADQCMMFYGLYSRGVQALAERILQPGDTVWDIGGQLGYFATMFARFVGERGAVVTFEPDPRAWQRLCRGLAASELENVDVRQLAIGARSEEIQLHVSPTVGWSSVVETDEPTLRAVPVTARSIDDLVAQGDLDPERLGLIKLDVEGGEHAALLGMRATLAGSRAPLICEYNEHGLEHAGVTADDLLAFFAGLGRQVQAIVEPTGVWRGGMPTLVDVECAADLPFALGDLLVTAS